MEVRDELSEFEGGGQAWRERDGGGQTENICEHNTQVHGTQRGTKVTQVEQLNIFRCDINQGTPGVGVQSFEAGWLEPWVSFSDQFSRNHITYGQGTRAYSFSIFMETNMYVAILAHSSVFQNCDLRPFQI